jgi:hypothetical protein
MFAKWNTAYASAIGTSHEKTGSPCQDACHCRVIYTNDRQEIFLGIASDGAGSASRSEVASKLAVEMFLEKFSRLIKTENDICLIDRNVVLDWLEEVKTQIFITAKNEALSPREFACTILGAVVGQNHSIFFQIGDGAIVVSETPIDEYGCIFWPQHGEFANQTNFIVQENLSEILEFEYSQGTVNRVALFTDGIERLVLDFSDRSVYPPALNSIFEWLHNNPQLNPDEIPSSALFTYLNSSFINSRTDDDKSLVMATRAAGEKSHDSTEAT